MFVLLSCQTFILESPANRSTNPLMKGRLSNCPKTGTRRMKLIATGKKPLNSTMKPYSSMHMPISGHPMRTVKIPPKKAPEPFHLCRWKKKRKLRSSPATKASPARNRILPMAKRPLSKRRMTPRKMKVTPKATNPTPIFCVSVMVIMLVLLVSSQPPRSPRRGRPHPGTIAVPAVLTGGLCCTSP